MSQVRSVGAVRFGLPGVALGLALAWWGGGQGPTSRLLGAPPAASVDSGANGLLAFTSSVGSTQPGSSAQLLYMIDTKTKAFSVYRVDPGNSQGSGSVKLVAARQCRWDLMMSEWNNQPPEVSNIEAAVNNLPKK